MVWLGLFFLSAPQSVWAMVLRSWIIWLHLILSCLMCGMKDSFRSSVTSKNLYCCISEPFNIRVGSLCILQKWMHLVLLLEILKPFFMVYFNMLLMHCCIFLSMVTMFL